MGVTLYVGADAQNMQRRRFNLTGPRCFSRAYGPGSRFTPEEAAEVRGIMDSGAFSDVRTGSRLSVEDALEGQLDWERRAERWWKYPWQAEAFASYDLLIDEKLVNGERRKERWTVKEADRAVRETVDAAAYLVSQRERLMPRKLLLGVQGVDDRQYQECAAGVLAHASPDDWVGLGGWCILGKERSWLPTFWAAMRLTLPMIADAGIKRVHIFGVCWMPPLGGLLWLADRLGLEVSTDSKAPATNALWANKARAGAYKETWEENVAHVRGMLANLRQSEHYREPPAPRLGRQLVMF